MAAALDRSDMEVAATAIGPNAKPKRTAKQSADRRRPGRRCVREH